MVICHTYEQTFDCYSVVTELDLGIDRFGGRDYAAPMTFTTASGYFAICTDLSEGQISYSDKLTHDDAWHYVNIYNSVDDVFFYGVQFVGKDEMESIIKQGESYDQDEPSWEQEETEDQVRNRKAWGNRLIPWYMR